MYADQHGRKKTCIQEIILTCLAQGDVCAFQRRPLFGEKCERDRSVLRVSGIDWLDFFLSFFSFFFFSCQQFAESAQSQCALLSLPSVPEQTKLLYKFTTISYIDVWGRLLFSAFKSPLRELIKSQCSFFFFLWQHGLRSQCMLRRTHPRL